jgi:sugar lactone lactonase YvrE
MASNERNFFKKVTATRNNRRGAPYEVGIMTHNPIIHTHLKKARKHCLSRLLALTLAIAGTAALSQVQAQSASTHSHTPKPGFVIYGDSGDAIQGGFLIGTDLNSGEQWVVSSGHYLLSPLYLAHTDESLIVSDHGLLLRIDLLTGEQSVMAELGDAWGIAVDQHGDILVATSRGIIRVDHNSGKIDEIATGGYLRFPLAIAIARNGDLIILDLGFPDRVIRINPHNGKQSLLCEGGDLHGSQAIAVRGDDIYITAMATSDGNFGIGRVVHVDLRTGVQTIISEGGYLVRPVGIDIDENGQIIVCDPYTINPQSLDLYDGGIIRIDPATGSQTLIARGHGNIVNPCGVVVMQ